jgi:hypothetical protein
MFVVFSSKKTQGNLPKTSPKPLKYRRQLLDLIIA